MDGMRALARLRGSSYDIKAELNQIERRIEIDIKETARIADLFKPSVYKPVLIGVILMTLQQFSGASAIAFNSTKIFHLAEFSYNLLIGVVLINAIQVFKSVFLFKKNYD